MAWGYGKTLRGEVSLDYVQISSADTTGVNLDQNFIIGRLRNRTFGKDERA